MMRAPLAVRMAAIVYGAMPLLILWLAETELTSPASLAPMALTLLGAPFIARGIWMVRRWAFFALPVHGLFLIALGGVDLTFYPSHRAPLALALLSAVVLFALVSRKAVRIPYVAQDGRGFRKARRHGVDLPSDLLLGERTRAARTVDISRGGAYLSCKTEGVIVGGRGWLVMTMRHREWRCQIRIASVSPEGLGLKPGGVGIEFTNLKDTDFESIDAFIALGRRYQRCEVALPISLQTSAHTHHTETVNLSLGGSFVTGGNDRFHPGDKVMISLTITEGDTIDCMAEVAWASADDHSSPHSGVALQFLDLGKADLKKLRRRLAALGSTR